MGADDRACPACGADNPARARFCLECGNKLPLDLVSQLPQDPDAGGERRLVTVIFADLSGFTAYSEVSDVEQVRDLATETADRLGDIVRRYDGHVDKVIGDCVMAIFGAPTAHEDDAERAVRAALDMQAYAKENAGNFAGLALSIGLNTGEAIWADVGGTHTVLGDTVNTAARIQGAAERGTVLVGDSTKQASESGIDYEEAEPITAKNKKEPVTVWTPVAVKGARVSRAIRTGLVGRNRELGRLTELFEHVRAERTPYLATLVGSAGIGKTRLVAALGDQLDGSATVLRGSCLPYGDGITYWPVIEILRQAAGIQVDDPTDVASRKLGTMLETLGSDDVEELRTMAVAVANLVGAPTTPRGTYTATEVSRAELHWGLRRIIELASQAAPLVLVLEDLHYAEPALVELLTFITAGEAGCMTLLLGTARPEIDADLVSALKAPKTGRVIDLGAIAGEAAADLVRELARIDDLPDDLVSRLVEDSGGNPLYLEEVVRMLVESGVLRSGCTAQDVAAVGVPQTVQGLIESRIDALPETPRRASGRAAVIGNTFWSGAVGHLSDGADVLDDLHHLEDHDVVRSLDTSTISGEEEFVFKHGLVRDVSYNRLARSQRSVLHERCAEWISALPSGEDEYLEIVGYHLEQACLLAGSGRRSGGQPPYVRAIKTLRSAAERAARREGLLEADRFFTRAITLAADRFPETEAELRFYRAETGESQGRTEEAVEEWLRVAEESVELGRPDLRGMALYKLASLDHVNGRVSQARERLEEAHSLALEAEDRDLEVRTLTAFAPLRAQLEGEVGAAVDDLRRAVAMADEHGDGRLQLDTRRHLAMTLFNNGDLTLAEKELRGCLELSAFQGSFQDEARVSYLLGVVELYRGELDEAEELATRVLQWVDRGEHQFMRLNLLKLLGKLALTRGDLAGAEERLKDALALAERFGAWLVADISRYLTDAVARQGEVEYALHLAQHVRAAEAGEDEYIEAATCLSEGSAAAALGDADRTRDRFERALEILERRELNLDRWEVGISYARWLLSLGDADGAAAQLQRVRDEAPERGAHGLVIEADALLPA